VSSFLSSTIQSFLARHGFSSQNQLDRTVARTDGSPSPRKRRKFIPEGDSGYAEVDQNEIRQTSPPPDNIENLPAPPLYILDVRDALFDVCVLPII